MLLTPLPRDIDLNIGRSVGPMFWGLVLSVFACGISVVQAQIYFHKNKDPKPLQVTAVTIFLFELLSTTLMIAAVFQYFVPLFGNVANIWTVSPTLAAECVFAIQITLIAQLFFAYQINRFRPAGSFSRIVMFVLLSFAIMSWLFGCVCFSMMFVNENWEHWVLGIEIGFTGSKGFAALFDIMSTTAMCIYLKEAQNEVLPATRRLLRTFQIIFLNRGLLVTLAQIALVTINWAWHGEMYWITPHLLVTRLYVNTFFAMLNTRKYLTSQYGLDRSEVVMSSGKTPTFISSGTHAANASGTLEIDSSASFSEKEGPLVFTAARGPKY